MAPWNKLPPLSHQSGIASGAGALAKAASTRPPPSPSVETRRPLSFTLKAAEDLSNKNENSKGRNYFHYVPSFGNALIHSRQ
jgi:hypothetical protein